MIYNIFEIKATGTTHKNKHGRTIENATNEQRAKITARNGGEALKEFINTLPLKKHGKVFKDGQIWIGTDENGITKYFAKKAVKV